MIDVMIDWPNLIVGAVLGFALALVPWAFDRRRSRRERVLDTRAEWMRAAKHIELSLRPEMTSGDFYVLRVSTVSDRWRSILGPSDFVVLDRLESSFAQVEGMATAFADAPTPENHQRLDAALLARRDAFAAFVNLSRAMQSESFHDLVTTEDRKQIREDYRQHPIRTWQRERRNRQAKQAGSP